MFGLEVIDFNTLLDFDLAVGNKFRAAHVNPFAFDKYSERGQVME